MELTPHQAKYFAQKLTMRTASDDLQKLVPSLMDARVDLNPFPDRLHSGLIFQFTTRKLTFTSNENCTAITSNSFLDNISLVKKNNYESN